MKQRCQSCGLEKDKLVKETYPYPDDGITTLKPIEPLLSVDCQGNDREDWRVATMCHACLHKLDVDMWINERMWRSLNPITPFEQLPKLQRT
jgi:hypothetical protein